MASPMWNHLQSAASTATLTNPASPFLPPFDLHFEYSAYVEELHQQLPPSKLKKSTSAPVSASTSTTHVPGLPSPTKETQDAAAAATSGNHNRKRNTLHRLHTYHEGLVRRKRTTDVDSYCGSVDSQAPPTPRYEIWAGKAVPASRPVSGSKSVYKPRPGVRLSAARFATVSVPSDHPECSRRFSVSTVNSSAESACTPPPPPDSPLEQPQEQPEEQPQEQQTIWRPKRNPPPNGIRRVKSDINDLAALTPDEAGSHESFYHGVVTQSMYAYGYSHAGPVEPISPPSSPDLTEHLNYDVSPIDDEGEDWDLPQRYYLRNEESSPTSKYHPHSEDQHTENQHGDHQPNGHQHNDHQDDDDHPRADHQDPGQDASEKSHTRSRTSSTASSQRPRNNIPAMRRERRRLQDTAAKVNREHKTVGLAPNGIQEVTPDSSLLLGSTTTITSNNQQNRRSHNNASPSFGERMRHFGKGKAEPIESRPAWNGGSGREASVQPLRDDLDAAPLKVHTQGKTLVGRGQATDKRVPELLYNTSAAATAAARKFMPSKQGQTANGGSFTHVQPAGASYSAASSIPLATGAPTRNDAPPHETPRDAPASSGVPRPDYSNQEKLIKRKPPPATLHAPTPTHATQPSISSSVYSTHAEARSHSESPQLGLIASDESELTGPWAQPPAPPAPAFSSESTTPSTSSPASPRPIPETEQAPLGGSGNSLPSVMERRRPLRGGGTPPEATPEDPIVISLKTATYASPKLDVEMDAKMNKGRSPSIMSTAKDLPLAPPEMIESDDRVAVLNAKLMGLAHRRNNINKSIQQMTELMPKDMLLTSAEVHHKREEEKRKVEILREELADVQQQEFDLGLKLHRANKRRERESEYEESGSLWIRRITG